MRLLQLQFSGMTLLFNTHLSVLSSVLYALPLSSISTTQFTHSSPPRGHPNHSWKKVRALGWPNPPCNNRCKLIAHSLSMKTLPALILILALVLQLRMKNIVLCSTSTPGLPTISGTPCILKLHGEGLELCIDSHTKQTGIHKHEIRRLQNKPSDCGGGN